MQNIKYYYFIWWIEIENYKGKWKIILIFFMLSHLKDFVPNHSRKYIWRILFWCPKNLHLCIRLIPLPDFSRFCYYKVFFVAVLIFTAYLECPYYCPIGFIQKCSSHFRTMIQTNTVLLVFLLRIAETEDYFSSQQVHPCTVLVFPQQSNTTYEAS